MPVESPPGLGEKESESLSFVMDNGRRFETIISLFLFLFSIGFSSFRYFLNASLLKTPSQYFFIA